MTITPAEIEWKRKWRRQGKARCIARVRALLGGKSTLAGYVPRHPYGCGCSRGSTCNQSRPAGPPPKDMKQ